ncbi:MAG: LysM peptidoglycan-binding domain-containing protein [Thiogranum sp.]|nr:LysM peptidoglycan-binding domain-containing protein [Thiogranum sp.]
MQKQSPKYLALLTLLLSACASQNTLPPAAETDPGTAESEPVLSNSTLLTATQSTAVRTPDFWAGLRAGFMLPDLDNSTVAQHRNWYIRHPEYLERVAERAQQYAWYISREIRKRGMPAEIALLPIVESAYDPFAYSHGRAAGLWQFIPATGKHFGLRQDWWYDGRRDIVDSTRAALDYLEYLHKRFDGDWLLALAAYNSGEGTVSNAQRKNRKKGKPTDFSHLDLPRETRNYVPKLIALKQLVAAPDHYGVELTSIASQPYFEVVDTDTQIDLAVAADLAGIAIDALYRLNPGFNQWATAPEGPHRLLIPVAQLDVFRQAIAALPAEQRLKWHRHKVSNGETLSHIAKRYNTTVSALKVANDLGGHSIRAGSHIMVPLSSQEPGNYQLSAGQRLNDRQNQARRGQKIQHRIGAGDTLWDLSRHYKVGVRKLAAWNGMAPGDTLRLGQKLVLWIDQSGASGSAHPGDQLRAVHYTVRQGDSLSAISSRFKVSVTDLRKWNGLTKGKYLQPGQRLKLYVNVTQQTSGA